MNNDTQDELDSSHEDITHEIVHEPRYWLITALAVILTAVIVGGGVWW